MKPKDKAYDIWQKMMCADLLVDSISAKQCALIAVDEVISVIDPETQIKTWLYFKEVKKEIEKL
jgi:hypothetical protein